MILFHGDFFGRAKGARYVCASTFAQQLCLGTITIGACVIHTHRATLSVVRLVSVSLGADMVMFIWQNHALNACSLKRLSIDLSNELLIVEKDQREPE